MSRVGIGYDVHKLVTDRKLILGGVDIPHEKVYLVILMLMYYFMQSLMLYLVLLLLVISANIFLTQMKDLKVSPA